MHPQPVPADDEVVVDPARVDDLLVLGADVRPDARRRTEVEGGVDDRSVVAERDAGRVDRRVLVGTHREHVVVDGAGTVSIEVEVRVVGQVHHGRGVRRRRHLHPYRVAVDAVGDPHRDLPRESLVAVGADQREDDLVGLVGLDRPDAAVEAVGAAVEAVAAVVGADLDLAAVDRERGRPRCGWRSGRSCRRGSRSSRAGRRRPHDRARRCAGRRHRRRPRAGARSRPASAPRPPVRARCRWSGSGPAGRRASYRRGSRARCER